MRHPYLQREDCHAAKCHLCQLQSLGTAGDVVMVQGEKWRKSAFRNNKGKGICARELRSREESTSDEGQR